MKRQIKDAPASAANAPRAGQRRDSPLTMDHSSTQPRAHDGYVYVLSAGPFVKVGRTKDPGHRIKALSIQLPFPVEIEAVIPCENHVRAERYLHWLMKVKRVNGEWFDLSGDPYMLPMLRDLVWISHENEDPEDDYCRLYDREDLA